MASEKINLKVYTPAGLVLEAGAASVTLQSSEGEIGILPHHTRYVGLLGVGTLEYIDPASSARHRLTVSKGFCNFVNENLVVLADSVEMTAVQT